jgi:hypothetical protein
MDLGVNALLTNIFDGLGDEGWVDILITIGLVSLLSSSSPSPSKILVSKALTPRSMASPPPTTWCSQFPTEEEMTLTFLMVQAMSTLHSSPLSLMLVSKV